MFLYRQLQHSILIDAVNTNIVLYTKPVRVINLCTNSGERARPSTRSDKKQVQILEIPFKKAVLALPQNVNNLFATKIATKITYLRTVECRCL